MAIEEGRFFAGSMTDKRFEADGLAEYCTRFLSSGVWSMGTNLQVTAGDDMSVVIDYGAALVEGYPYRVRDNGTGMLSLAVKDADAANPRIDRVVVRKDTTTLRISAYVLSGTAAASPLAPFLTRNDEVYEISLARIFIPAGSNGVTASNVVDDRRDPAVCGTVYSRLNPDLSSYLKTSELLAAILTVDGDGSGVDADMLDGQHGSSFLRTSASCNKNWNWSGQSGQPSWLWGGNDGTNMYVWNPSNFSVNYAGSSGWANDSGNLDGHDWSFFLSTGAGNVRFGQCTLATANEVWVGFSSAMRGNPIVMLCLATTQGSAIPAPKVRGVNSSGFNAIIGGSGFSGIVCNYIAVC